MTLVLLATHLPWQYIARIDVQLDPNHRSELKSSAATQHKAFEAMKKELRDLRSTVTNSRFLAFGQDEVTMCTSRIRLRLEGEEVAEIDETHIIWPFQVPELKRKYQTDIVRPFTLLILIVL